MNEVMSGITIIEQNEIMMTPNWLFILLIISAIVLLILFLRVSYVVIIKQKKDISLKLFVLTVAFSLIAGGSGIAIAIVKTVPTGKYMYKCTIDDTVSLTEFYEEYEIVSKTDTEWIIKDR